MMGNSYLAVVAVLSCACLAYSLKLPSYIKPCSRNDPELSACVLKNGQVSLKQMIKYGGDRKYNIPSFIPLKITELNVDQNGLKLTMRDLKLYGLEDTLLTAATMDLKARHSEIEMKIPRLEAIFNYEISGKILVLPIQGTGPANITIPDLTLHGSYDFDLKKGKTGKEHMSVKNTELSFEKTKGYIQLDNLFGNKEISDNMNLVLNESSEDVISDVGPAVAKALSQVCQQIFNGLNAGVPYEDMYPEVV